MLQESEIAAQVNLGDSAVLGSQAQGDATQKWQTEFQQTNAKFTSISSNSGAENVLVSQLSTGNKALDLFPSPGDIWSQRAGDMVRVQYQNGAQAPQTPMDRLGLAMRQYEGGGKKLTPELRREFENIIVASDVPSPLVPGMKQRLTELAAEGKKLLTDSKKKEIDDSRLALETSVKALNPEKQKQIQGLAQARSFARGDEKLTRGFETQMEQVAPGLLAKLKAYEKATEPLSKIEDEYGDISEQLAAEQGQSIITRSTYSYLLIKAADKTTAAKHLSDAARKEPALLENPEFIELLTGAGLKASDLKKRP